MVSDIEKLERRVAETYLNARTCGKEGAGTHRNAGDSGRVAALHFEAKRDFAHAQCKAKLMGGK